MHSGQVRRASPSPTSSDRGTALDVCLLAGGGLEHTRRSQDLGRMRIRMDSGARISIDRRMLRPSCSVS
ncbi:MAG: hypothetical protein VX911_00530 [Candidatus Latescibacterota bacterium]|nr:hypothetical protein [Candidatus Latescibacterota bacterium]